LSGVRKRAAEMDERETVTVSLAQLEKLERVYGAAVLLVSLWDRNSAAQAVSQDTREACAPASTPTVSMMNVAKRALILAVNGR